MPPLQKTTGRIARTIRRALTSLVPDGYPTIDEPATGGVVPGGSLTVTVSTNQPGMGHTVRVISTDGLETVHDTQPVSFPGGVSPGTATVTLPPAGGADAEYFVEVGPTSGPPHRIVVTVLMAGTPLALTVDYNGIPPGTYPGPLDLILTGVASGGGGEPYTYEWLNSAGGSIHDASRLSIGLPASNGSTSIYTLRCTVRDPLGATDFMDVTYTVT